MSLAFILALVVLNAFSVLWLFLVYRDCARFRRSQFFVLGGTNQHEFDKVGHKFLPVFYVLLLLSFSVFSFYYFLG